MPIYERGHVRIRYEEAGFGFPLLIIPGGGLNSTIAGLSTNHPFNPLKEFSNEFRVIAADLRNASGGESSGPLEVDRPWDSYTDDHLGLMDHLGIDKFMVLGFCIGGPFIWNLIKRAPNRVVAAVPTQPSGSRPELLQVGLDELIDIAVHDTLNVSDLQLGPVVVHHRVRLEYVRSNLMAPTNFRFIGGLGVQLFFLFSKL